MDRVQFGHRIAKFVMALLIGVIVVKIAFLPDRPTPNAMAPAESADTHGETAGQACETGVRTKRFADPLQACLVAYNSSLLNAKYDQVLRYAVLGCEKYHNTYFCSRITALPHTVRFGDEPTPETFTPELRRLANLVCLSDARFDNSAGADITGRLCAHFARQFILAKEENRKSISAAISQRYLEAVYDPRRAGELHKVACERWGYINSCREARELRQRVEFSEDVIRSAEAEPLRP